MSFDENNFSEEQIIKKELFSKKSITKNNSDADPKSDDSKSKMQQIEDFIKEKIESGYELKDRNSKLELNKITRDSLKLPKGWQSDVNKGIKKIAIEKKLAISDLGYKDEIDGITLNLIKEESEPTKESQPTQSPYSALPTNSTITGSPRGALPKTQTEQEEQQEPQPEKKIMSADAQSRLIKTGFNKLLAPLYISMGIVQPDEEEKEDEAKLPTAKQFRKDMDNLADEINEYLIENKIQLPALLNHLSIGVSIFMVLILPVIKFKFFSSNQSAKPEYDESANDVKVKL